jgi:hypothetical protein
VKSKRKKGHLRGYRSAPRVEPLPLVRQPHYADGWALVDELSLAIDEAHKAAGRPNPKDLPLLGDVTGDERIQDSDLVTMPYWAAKGARDRLALRLLSDRRGMARYHADMIDYQRYALCREALNKGVKWPPAEPNVFEVVRDQLAGTNFGAGVNGIKKSFEKVTRALKRGEHKRYYRSTAYPIYDYFINKPGTIYVCY